MRRGDPAVNRRRRRGAADSGGISRCVRDNPPEPQLSHRIPHCGTPLTVRRFSTPNSRVPKSPKIQVEETIMKLRPLQDRRSEEHTSELQSLMRISYAVFCLKKKTQSTLHTPPHNH